VNDLFFVLSKTLWSIARPETWFVWLLVVALLAILKNRRNLAMGCLLACIAAFVLIAVVPVAGIFLAPLERQFPARPQLTDPGLIVVLGGGEDISQSAATGMVNTNDAGERLLSAIELATAHPQAKLILSGNSGRLLGTTVGSAEIMAQALVAAGVSSDRLLLDRHSRNTAENAQRSAELVATGIDQPMVLVTSAYHMPRSVGVFCVAGWTDIIPYPVDHRASEGSFQVGWSFAGNLEDLNHGVREWIGLVAYRVTGRIRQLVPKGC
jgi:uncharacterized SAM-binding protein YcdF (DUF218 family)